MPRREGAGELAAEIAAVLTERGLGGDDVDLAPSARSVPPRPLAPRRGRARDGEALGARSRRAASRRRAGRASACRSARCSRSPIPTASPRTAAASGGVPARQRPRRHVDPASPLAREPFLAVAELTGSGGARAASCWRRRSRWRRSRRASPTASRTATTVDLRCRVRVACARGARAGSARSCSPSRPQPVDAGRRHRAHCSPKASPRSASAGCRGARRCCNGATACRSCARAEGDEWPDLSDAALARQRRRMARAVLAGKTALVADRRRRSCRRARRACCRGRCAGGSTPRRRRISPRRPARACRSTTTAEQGPTLSIRVQELFGLAAASRDRRRPRAAGDRTAVAGAPAGAGDARPAGLLARQLCRGARPRCAAAIRAIPGRTIRSRAPATRRAKPRGSKISICASALTASLTTSPMPPARRALRRHLARRAWSTNHRAHPCVRSSFSPASSWRGRRFCRALRRPRRVEHPARRPRAAAGRLEQPRQPVRYSAR